MICIVARMKVASGKEQEFESTIAGLVAQVVAKEPGCSLYQLCKGGEPGDYVMIERYADQDAVGAHMQSEHFQAAMPVLGGLLDGQPQIELLTEVG